MKNLSRKNPSYRALLALLRTSGILSKAGDRILQGFGLTQSQFNVLMVLKNEKPQGCSQRELSTLLLVNRANVTGLVKRLLTLKLIERHDHPTDERVWIVKLSRRGEKKLRIVERPYYQKISEIMGVFTEKQSREFQSLLQKTLLGMEGHPE